MHGMICMTAQSTKWATLDEKRGTLAWRSWRGQVGLRQESVQWFVVGSELVRSVAAQTRRPSNNIHLSNCIGHKFNETFSSGSRWSVSVEGYVHTTELLAFLYRLYFSGPFFVAFPNLREALINNTPIQTKNRSSTILPNYVGCVFATVGYSRVELLTTACRIRFLVHNGKDYLPVVVTKDMVGHKLGEFSHTKKRFTYRWVISKPTQCDWGDALLQGD